jgi:hypothetical protein
MWDVSEYKNKVSNKVFAEYALSSLAWRVYYECNEDSAKAAYQQQLIHQSATVHSSTISTEINQETNVPSSSLSLPFNLIHQNTRRKVSIVMIFIGSSQRIQLIYQQSKVLQIIQNLIQQQKGHAPSTSSYKQLEVISWLGIDSLYPCQKGTTRCTSSNKRYAGYLTYSAVNSMSSGWACAQRRPLRALSHVLLLFEPEVIIILDDDTFFNLPLFLEKYFFSHNPHSIMNAS